MKRYIPLTIALIVFAAPVIGADRLTLWDFWVRIWSLEVENSEQQDQIDRLELFRGASAIIIKDGARIARVFNIMTEQHRPIFVSISETNFIFGFDYERPNGAIAYPENNAKTLYQTADCSGPAFIEANYILGGFPLYEAFDLFDGALFEADYAGDGTPYSGWYVPSGEPVSYLDFGSQATGDGSGCFAYSPLRSFSAYRLYPNDPAVTGVSVLAVYPPYGGRLWFDSPVTVEF